MTSVLRTIAQNPFGTTNALLSGGNGSGEGAQRAIATIDPRFGNTFIIDATGLTKSGADIVHILVKSVKANVGATMPGKVIHLIFKLLPPPYASPATGNITCYFDTSLGDIASLSTGGYTYPVLPISLIANGSQFQLLTDSPQWGGS